MNSGDGKEKRHKRTFSTSVAVTEKNLAYMRRLPNVSELFRRFLDAMEAADEEIEQKLATVILEAELEKLNSQREELGKKKVEFYDNNARFWEYETKETIAKVFDDNPETFAPGEIPFKDVILTERILKKDANGDPIPIESEDAKLAFKRLKAMDAAIVSLGTKVEEVKKLIIAA